MWSRGEACAARAVGLPDYPAQVNQNSGYATSGPLAYPGHTLDLNLGVIAPGDQVSFHLYYGVAPTLSAAQAAVDQVDADVSYLVYAQDPTTSTPATGIFAYRTD